MNKLRVYSASLITLVSSALFTVQKVFADSAMEPIVDPTAPVTPVTQPVQQGPYMLIIVGGAVIVLAVISFAVIAMIKCKNNVDK